MKTLVVIAVGLFFALVYPDASNCIVVVTRPLIAPQRRVSRGHFRQLQQRPSPVWMPGRGRQARGSPTDAAPIGGLPIPALPNPALPMGGYPGSLPTVGSYPGGSSPGSLPTASLISTLAGIGVIVADEFRDASSSQAAGTSQALNDGGSSLTATGANVATTLVQVGSTMGMNVQGTVNKVVAGAVGTGNDGASGIQETLKDLDLGLIATGVLVAKSFQEMANMPGRSGSQAVAADGDALQSGLTRLAELAGSASEYGHRKRRTV